MASSGITGTCITQHFNPAARSLARSCSGDCFDCSCFCWNVASLNTSTGVVSWTPSCGQVGTFGPFTLKATAASGEFGTGSFSITVTHKAGTVTVNRKSIN